MAGIIIPDGVTSIGDFAFSGCSSLTSIAIPDSMTRIGDSALETCISLTSKYAGLAAEAACGREHGNEKLTAANDTLKAKGFHINSDEVADTIAAAWKQLNIEEIATGITKPGNGKRGDRLLYAGDPLIPIYADTTIEPCTYRATFV